MLVLEAGKTGGDIELFHHSQFDGGNSTAGAASLYSVLLEAFKGKGRRKTGGAGRFPTGGPRVHRAGGDNLVSAFHRRCRTLAAGRGSVYTVVRQKSLAGIQLPEIPGLAGIPGESALVIPPGRPQRDPAGVAISVSGRRDLPLT